MKILIYVDNEQNGKWGLLKILEKVPETEEELKEWYEHSAGTEETLREEITWSDEYRSEVMVPHSGVYVAGYTVLPHICDYPECAHDDVETQVDILYEIPLTGIAANP